ncbi:MAG: NAD-dependent epimerase/dehydratase family protein [Planctomycetes bacterium]|nr:NAD-dependent epimerase/dehydratase family protein [Planctomycetota bacterium]
MHLADKKLLVIGGAGLIGSHTVDRLLDEDVSVIRVFDNFTRGSRENLETALADPRVEVFPLGGELLHRDLLREAMEGMDGVFHFAAMWLRHCQDFPRSAFEVNIAGTFNVVEACIATGVKRLVYSSSASVYGDAVAEPMTEDHPFDNTNFYGATKIAGEAMCRALHHRHRGTDQNFDYVGLRYMNVYGPRQDYRGEYVSVVMSMLDRIERGLPPVVFGDGSQSYDFVYVGDCAAANVCAMKAETTDRFYNVGTGEKTSILELAEMLLELTGSDLTLAYEPGGTTFVRNRVGCPRRAAEEIGFTAGVELREGMQRLIEWRRGHAGEVERRREDAGVPG